MHDFSLGGPVDVGDYTGPVVDGRPLHEGNCEDGVYGCRMCNRGARTLTDEQLVSIGFSTESECDWCHKKVAPRDLSGVAPWDEGGSVYYEICGDCRGKYNKELARVLAEDEEDEDNDEPDFYDLDDDE